MKLEELSIQKTARIALSDNVDSARNLLIALHGYGQLPYYFLRKFAGLDASWAVACPEGLHRFYLNGTEGRVGASWMTKEARETDISDNLLFLDTVLQKLTENRNWESIAVLGFSQGGATASRWVTLREPKIDQFILWASIIPPDLPLDDFNQLHIQKHFVLGTEDPYFEGDNYEKVKKLHLDFGFQFTDFTGKHDIDVNTLEKILKNKQ